MEDIAARYRRLAGHFADLIAAVPPEKWSAPTPCDAWTTRELVTHVVDTQAMFLGLVDLPAGIGPPPAEDPAGAWQVASATVQAALDDPALATRTFQGYFGESTFEQAAEGFLNFDLVVHGWDLARASGGDERLAADDIAHVVAGIPEFGDALRSSGICGPAVDVADDADAQTQMLGLVGRRA